MLQGKVGEGMFVVSRLSCDNRVNILVEDKSVINKCDVKHFMFFFNTVYTFFLRLWWKKYMVVWLAAVVDNTPLTDGLLSCEVPFLALLRVINTIY
jgi:hypothetical protein